VTTNARLAAILADYLAAMSDPEQPTPPISPDADGRGPLLLSPALQRAYEPPTIANPDDMAPRRWLRRVG